jgi:peptidoglycan/xylan/chitin deacetylase (PgdA/CDA1 family)
MMIRFAILPLLLALNLSMCKKQETVAEKPKAAGSASPAATTEAAAPVAAAPPKVTKPVVDQTAQVIIFCYHRLVDKVRYPGTEITPAAFEAQMQELKDKGITVIPMQDLLAWKRGEKNIPPRCAVITFDDGWETQYEVAWPIMKKFGYPFTLFIYTEGVRGGSLGGGGAITWEQLADMRDNGVDIEAHSATHQDLREGHTVMVIEPGGKRTRKKLTGAEYDKWVQNEVVGCKELLEQRLGIKVNCYAVPFGNYNEHVKELARNAGYEAMFTVYGQPITFTSPMDALGRYAIEANKPKVFEYTAGRRRDGAHGIAAYQSEPQQHRPDRPWQCANAGKWTWARSCQIRRQNRHRVISSPAETARQNVHRDCERKIRR